MSAALSTEQACNALPRVLPHYEPKGTFVDASSPDALDGLKTYATFHQPGHLAKAAVVYIYDIYGYCPQNYQGADLIAAAGFDVYVPDMHKGGSLDQAKLKAMSQEDGMKYREAFRAGFPGKIESQREPYRRIIAQLKAKGYTTIGGAGFCWGGNLNVSMPELDAIAMVHPGAAVNAGAAEALSSPTCLLPSQNEDETNMEAFHKAMLAKPFADQCILKWFKDSPHGFAASRANLDDEKSRAVFAEAHAILVKFFQDTL